MKQTRLRPEVRKEAILAAALKLAEKQGYQHITREQIAAAVGVAGSLVQYHFGTMQKLRRGLMRHAIVQQNLRVIAQGITAGDDLIAKVEPALRKRALDSMR